jgi:hypothetical protein
MVPTLSSLYQDIELKDRAPCVHSRNSFPEQRIVYKGLVREVGRGKVRE